MWGTEKHESQRGVQNIAVTAFRTVRSCDQGFFHNDTAQAVCAEDDPSAALNVAVSFHAVNEDQSEHRLDKVWKRGKPPKSNGPLTV